MTDDLWRLDQPIAHYRFADYRAILGRFASGDLELFEVAEALRAYDFQGDNHSFWDELVLQPMLASLDRRLYDPGWDQGDLRQLLRRMLDEVDAVAAGMFDVLARDTVFYPRRFALVNWTIVEAFDFELLPDRTKGLMVGTEAVEPTLETMLRPAGLAPARVERFSAIQAWWQAYPLVRLRRSPDRRVAVLAASEGRFLLHEPAELATSEGGVAFSLRVVTREDLMSLDFAEVDDELPASITMWRSSWSRYSEGSRRI